MNVRVANNEDLLPLSQFVTEWVIYEMLVQGFIFDETIFKQHLQMLIDSKNVMVLEHDDIIVGGVGGRIVQSFYTKDIIFDVMTMYIDPEYRKFTAYVLQAVEKIMTLTTVTKIVLCVPAFSDYEKHCRYYRIKGYRRLQTSFIKDIKPEVL